MSALDLDKFIVNNPFNVPAYCELALGWSLGLEPFHSKDLNFENYAILRAAMGFLAELNEFEKNPSEDELGDVCFWLAVMSNFYPIESNNSFYPCPSKEAFIDTVEKLTRIGVCQKDNRDQLIAAIYRYMQVTTTKLFSGLSNSLPREVILKNVWKVSHRIAYNIFTGDESYPISEYFSMRDGIEKMGKVVLPTYHGIEISLGLTEYVKKSMMSVLT